MFVYNVADDDGHGLDGAILKAIFTGSGIDLERKL